MRRFLVLVGVVLVGFAAAAYVNREPNDGASLRAALQGARIEFDRKTVDFGTTPVGASRTSSVVMTNWSSQPLTVAKFESDEAFQPLQGKVELEPGDASLVTFAFRPQRPGPHQLRIFAETEAGRVGALYLRGIGDSPPEMTIEPRALDFGPVAVGDERSAPIKISNHGYGALRISVSESHGHST